MSTKKYRELIKLTEIVEGDFERLKSENKTLREEKFEASKMLRQCQILLLSSFSKNDLKRSRTMDFSQIFKFNAIGLEYH
jgi:hypothetical protein